MNTVLSPMACLQARLDYAHHVSKKANRKGSHADDKAICIAQDSHTRSELAKAVKEMIKQNPYKSEEFCHNWKNNLIATSMADAHDRALQAVLKAQEGTK